MSAPASHPDGFGAALEVAATRWPSVAFDPDAVLETLQGMGVDLPRLAGRSEFPSLLLVAMCLRSDPAALAVFDGQLTGAVETVARRMQLDPDRAAEVTQRLRDRLLTGRGQTEPKLATFEASGPLGSWLRVCAAREALMMARAEAHDAPLGNALEDELEPLFDPELQLIKADGRTALKRAFQTAFGELSTRQKTLLAQTLLDGLTLRQVGKIQGVDASTVSRWLSRAREQLLARTQTLMSTEAKIEGHEFEEIVDLVRSQLDLSISRMLRDEAKP